ncbi:hypothetical protein HHK36_020147 [Tetracentron sinense]|uniref:Uncharacterized protein n=1 Tax=Tetracentron sinense TaxID=13715 RepID=A0A834YUX6_TETSI|nr:hypothetical protein HHK36_020147 [Tetracentron sinense]
MQSNGKASGNKRSSDFDLGFVNYVEVSEFDLAEMIISSEGSSCLIIIDILKTTMVGKLPNDLEGMEASMECLLALIDDVYKYVDDVVHNKDTTRLGRKVEHSCSDPVTMTPEPLIPQGCRQVHLGKSKGFWKTILEDTWSEAFDGLGISLLLTSNPAIQVSFKCQCSCQIITLNLSKEGEYF